LGLWTWKNLRHLPEIFGDSCNYYGTDYNKKSIEWCKNNLPGIAFNHNSLKAILPYEDNQMDVIYGISIFTHLSEKMHHEWFKELYRVLNKGGIMFLTTQGHQFKAKLKDNEIAEFDNGKLVIRGKVKEGHRTYSAFHPTSFMLNLFRNMEILDHIENRPIQGNYIPQDIWIIRKS
jgi:ubiquinone/menaquinone biosynthesis C-methylase UbiE